MTDEQMPLLPELWGIIATHLCPADQVALQRVCRASHARRPGHLLLRLPPLSQALAGRIEWVERPFLTRVYRALGAVAWRIPAPVQTTLAPLQVRLAWTVPGTSESLTLVADNTDSFVHSTKASLHSVPATRPWAPEYTGPADVYLVPDGLLNVHDERPVGERSRFYTTYRTELEVRQDSHAPMWTWHSSFDLHGQMQDYTYRNTWSLADLGLRPDGTLYRVDYENWDPPTTRV